MIASTIAGASVLSALICGRSPSARWKLSVLAAPIARAASLALPATASAAALCGIVTLSPAHDRVGGELGDRVRELLGRAARARRRSTPPPARSACSAAVCMRGDSECEIG